MRFASGFITAIVVNPPERKLAKRTSVHCICKQYVNHNLSKISLLVIQQLRGPNFTQFWPPTPIEGRQLWNSFKLPFVYVTKRGLYTDHLPTFSCARSY